MYSIILGIAMAIVFASLILRVFYRALPKKSGIISEASVNEYRANGVIRIAAKVKVWFSNNTTKVFSMSRVEKEKNRASIDRIKNEINSLKDEKINYYYIPFLLVGYIDHSLLVPKLWPTIALIAIISIPLASAIGVEFFHVNLIFKAIAVCLQ